MSFSPITDHLNQHAIAQADTRAEVQVKIRDEFTWSTAIRAVESGSWAVIVTVAILWIVARKPLGRLFENQMALMVALKDNLGKVSNNQEKLTDTQKTQAVQIEHIYETLDKVAANDAQVANVLTELASNKKQIEERQLQQIDLLKQILSNQNQK